MALRTAGLLVGPSHAAAGQAGLSVGSALHVRRGLLHVPLLGLMRHICFMHPARLAVAATLLAGSATAPSLAPTLEFSGPPGSAKPFLTATPSGGLLATWFEPRDSGRFALRVATRRDGRWSTPATVAQRDNFFRELGGLSLGGRDAGRPLDRALAREDRHEKLCLSHPTERFRRPGRQLERAGHPPQRPFHHRARFRGHVGPPQRRC